jgi:hypothetical protein
MFAATASPAKAPIRGRKRDFLPVEFAYSVVSLLRRVIEMAYTPIRLSLRFLGFINLLQKKKKQRVLKYKRRSHITEKVI